MDHTGTCKNLCIGHCNGRSCVLKQTCWYIAPLQLHFATLGLKYLAQPRELILNVIIMEMFV